MNCWQFSFISFRICREDRSRGIRKDFYLFFVPHKSLLCEKRLKNKGVFGNFSVEEFTCELFPFDNDLMSMEIQYAFKVINLQDQIIKLASCCQSKNFTTSTPLLTKKFLNKGH